jgi:3',5'-cyclic AMP phosphodiesterase CpdA
MSGETGSDCMILAGDVSDNLDIFRATLTCFTRKYKVSYEQSRLPGSTAVKPKCVDMHVQYVFFVPGNHDLWTRREERGKHTSLGKSVPSSS